MTMKDKFKLHKNMQ